MDIVVTEHARYKMHTWAPASPAVLDAVKKAVAKPSSMRRVLSEENTYMVPVNSDLRAIVRLEAGRAIVVTVMQREP